MKLLRSLRSHPRVYTRGSPKRNSVRFALSVTAFHFLRSLQLNKKATASRRTPNGWVKITPLSRSGLRSIRGCAPWRRRRRGRGCHIPAGASRCSPVRPEAGSCLRRDISA